MSPPAKRIRPHIRETPVEHSPCLSRLGDCKAYLKLENAQLTDSRSNPEKSSVKRIKDKDELQERWK